MPSLLIFGTHVDSTQLIAELTGAPGFQRAVPGGRDAYEGETPAAVSMELPSNALFHPTYTPREATKVFAGSCQVVGIDPGQYMAFELAVPLDGQGRITEYLH